MPQLGTGITLTFQSGLFAEILNVDRSGIKREAINASHHGTTGGEVFIPSANFDPGEAKIEFAFLPGTDYLDAMTAAIETVTLTHPNVDASTEACDGFLMDLEWGAPYEDRMTGSATLKYSGTPVHTV